ncbi:hypothetical protein GUJ93_ZPchr0010g9624 [Zizania palustris]|uniref:Uncharacterized protein n=1 Tax=Zizania palustris TaxID=103762 RepID=A0A8J6BLC1_ZIZPA|nr:hypothetical protein GUJ93_ZPchr0010g9624 [Zizania palustris]
MAAAASSLLGRCLRAVVVPEIAGRHALRRVRGISVPTLLRSPTTTTPSLLLLAGSCRRRLKHDSAGAAGIWGEKQAFDHGGAVGAGDDGELPKDHASGGISSTQSRDYHTDAATAAVRKHGDGGRAVRLGYPEPTHSEPQTN